MLAAAWAPVFGYWVPFNFTVSLQFHYVAGKNLHII